MAPKKPARKRSVTTRPTARRSTTKQSAARRPLGRPSAAGTMNILAGQRTIPLPAPSSSRGLSVFSALEQRKTVRSISDRGLPLQILSDLLWSACGINRESGPFGIPGRTAASASNSQEIDVYVAVEAGTYRYVPIPHSLLLVSPEDLRPLAIGPGQGMAGAKAPVRLIYVVDIAKFAKAGFQEPGLWNQEIQKSYYYVDTGLIAANVYLFAASRGLAAWFHNCNRKELAHKLKLGPDQHVLFGQTFGYPE